ncbi:hypothetical protein C6568_01740 [Melaminivora suipulveris]|uniref:Uncharacterized protein n=1 Tax=Melaminivora suipulveris TaxID=2109913 RepID=A0A2R3Q8L2_9BURK|nr:hypothetical protein [Melaminivora suipulveris]AVO48118.1 hypothetical protein C6568_01740 [Melaminivora suipulveris]
MIAANYRKHPEALALQLPLPFGIGLRWALPRPTTRVLRAIRVARAKAFTAIGRVRYVEPAKAPAWWTAAQAARRVFAAGVRAACMALFT